jgi:acetylcholinesterase
MVVSLQQTSVEAVLTADIIAGMPVWLPYGKSSTNFVFRTDRSYVEKDDDRKEGVAFINSIVR